MNTEDADLRRFPRSTGLREWLKREWDAIAHPRPLIRAVIRTYELFKQEGRVPGSEVLFGNNEPYFTAHALPAIRAAWADETKRDPLEFPWSTWFAMYSWVSWRKTVAGMKDRVKQRLDLADPPVSAPQSDRQG